VYISPKTGDVWTAERKFPFVKEVMMVKLEILKKTRRHNPKTS
jgi:hypothetical protein